jgi:hypothetical protein
MKTLISENIQADTNEILESLRKKIKQVENEQYIKCSHPNSDAMICLMLNYELWQLKVKLQNLESVKIYK